MAITAEFTADFNQFNAAVKDATAGLATMEGQTQQLDAQMADLAYKAGQGITQIARDLTAAAGAFLDSYSEEEAATQRLVTALEAQGTATDAVISDFANMATQFQNTTRYSDDMVTSAQALFTTIGRVGPQDMQAAITAATNLASVLGVDLQTATTMLARAVATGGESLGKLSPLLADVDVKGKSAAEMFAIINEKTGPAAADALKTYAGQTAYLANQMDDARGKIGALLAQALLPLVQAFTSLPAPLQTVAAGAVALGVALTPIAVSIGALTPAITALAGAMGITLAGALATVGALLLPGAAIVAGITAVYLAFRNWDAIVGIVQNVYNGIKTWLVDRFNALVSMILAPVNAVISGFKGMYQKVVGGSYVPDMVDGIGQHFKRLDRLMVDPTNAAVAKVMSAFNIMSHNLIVQLTDAGGVARDAFGNPTMAIAGLTKSMGQQNITVNVNGSVLSTKDQLAMVVQDAMMGSYRRGGNRLPT